MNMKYLFTGLLAAVSLGFVYSNTNPKWIAHEADEDLDFHGIPMPMKKTDISSAEDACVARLPRIVHENYLDTQQISAHQEAIKLLIDSWKSFHAMAPADIRKILHVYDGYMHKKECVYILQTSATSFKAGESHDCKQRVIEQQDGADKVKFILMPPNQFIPSGLIAQDTIDSIMKLHLPMFNGVHKDRRDRLEKKVTRQIAELYITCSYDFKAGSVAEFILRTPSKREGELNDVSNIFGEGTDIRRWVEKNMGNIKKVHDVDTWPTMDSYLRRPEFSDLSNFLSDKSPDDFLTGHLCRLNVDREKYTGIGDSIEVCPYYKSTLPHVERLNRLFSMGSSPSFGGVAGILAMISSEEYEYPDEDSYPDDIQTRISSALEREGSGTLIRVRTEMMKRVRDTPWYSDTFSESIDVHSLKVKAVVEGAEGEVELVEEETIMTLHRTNSCHIVLERVSHFLILAPSQRKMVRLNAIHNYLVESVLMENIHVLDSNALSKIQDVMLSMTMLLNGPKKTLNGQASSIAEMRLFTLPVGISDGGKMPAQIHIQPHFQVVNHLIPYRAILLILHVMQDNKFNDLLSVLESEHVIESRGGKYYLMVDGSKMYHHHHNFYTGKQSTDEALELISTMDKTTLRSMHTFLFMLYEGVDDSNEPSLSMSYRFDVARQELLESNSDDTDTQQFIDTLDLCERYNQFQRLSTFVKHVDVVESFKSDENNLYNGVCWIGSCFSSHPNTYLYFPRLRQENGLLTDKFKEELVLLGFGYLGDSSEYERTSQMVQRVRLEREQRRTSSMLAGLDESEQCDADGYEYSDDDDEEW